MQKKRGRLQRHWKDAFSKLFRARDVFVENSSRMIFCIMCHVRREMEMLVSLEDVALFVKRKIKKLL